MLRSAAIALCASLAACSAAQTASTGQAVTTGLSAIETACLAAEQAKVTAQALVKGGAANTVAAVGAYVDAGCTTAAALNALASNPTSQEWLGQLTGTLNTIAKPPAT